ncbi:hypothetical protein Tco_0773388 [Tanacetum coccineum]|uniref:Uncharacterized protein n=1 Tax=Tanacetum coccineum TaxID=301880 RepID=A0ABQ4ZLL5_9ASTR
MMVAAVGSHGGDEDDELVAAEGGDEVVETMVDDCCGASAVVAGEGGGARCSDSGDDGVSLVSDVCKVRRLISDEAKGLVVCSGVANALVQYYGALITIQFLVNCQPSTDLRSLYQSRLLWTRQFLMSVRHGELMTICCVVAKPTLKQSFPTPLQLLDTQIIVTTTKRSSKHHHFKVAYSELASLLISTIDSMPHPSYPLEASCST